MKEQPQNNQTTTKNWCTMAREVNGRNVLGEGIWLLWVDTEAANEGSGEWKRDGACSSVSILCLLSRSTIAGCRALCCRSGNDYVLPPPKLTRSLQPIVVTLFPMTVLRMLWIQVLIYSFFFYMKGHHQDKCSQRCAGMLAQFLFLITLKQGDIFFVIYCKL